MQQAHGKLARLAKKSPSEFIASLRWHVQDIQKRCIAEVCFGTVPWSPKGLLPRFSAYYPDSIGSFPDRVDLYRRWIRGNKFNNNGDAARFVAFLLNLRQLQNEGIEGDFAELGVWKGNSAAVLAAFADASSRKLFLFDTFSGFDSRDMAGEERPKNGDFENTSIGFVKTTIGRNSSTVFVPGYFPDSINPEVEASKYAFVHIDCDLYAPMKSALEFFYHRMSKGGMLILHDYSSGNWSGATRAVDEFRNTTGEYLSLWPDKSGTAMIRKTR
jgi:hypothetical protein